MQVHSSLLTTIVQLERHVERYDVRRMTLRHLLPLPCPYFPVNHTYVTPLPHTIARPLAIMCLFFGDVSVYVLIKMHLLPSEVGVGRRTSQSQCSLRSLIVSYFRPQALPCRA